MIIMVGVETDRLSAVAAASSPRSTASKKDGVGRNRNREDEGDDQKHDETRHRREARGGRSAREGGAGGARGAGSVLGALL